MTSRIGKQAVYGTIYLLFFFLIVFLIYLAFFRPAPTCFDGRQNQGETGIDCGGPCASCEIKTLSPVEPNWIKYFSNDNQTVIAAEIKNPNPKWAADSFSYIFDVYGENGAKLKTLTKNSFIYAGEIKYLVEVPDVDFKNITSVKISFSNINWVTADEFTKPTVQAREIKTEPASQDPNRVTVSGFIANNNAFPLSKVRIIGFLFNSGGLQISASKTELENIAAFKEELFKLNFPKNISLPTTSVGTSSPSFTRNLTIGSSGNDVKALQEFLKEQGFFDRGITDYFGSVTKNALVQFQKNAGISPASGYFGPKTREYINSLESVAPTTPVTPNLSLTEADPAKTKIYVEALR